MLPLTLLAAASAVSAASFVRRGLDELWNGYNITAAALEIEASISSPTCNSTTYCQTFVKQVVPQCLSLQGTAGCWCTLHDPLHYCAICMSSPTDNTTTPAQTQTALEGHGNYHKGCAAYQAYLNATATGSTSSSPIITSTSESSSATAAAASSGSSSIGTGPLVGAIIGGIIGLVIILAATLLLYRRLQNQHKLHEVTAATGAPKVDPDMGGGGDPSRVTSYYGKVDMNGGTISYPTSPHGQAISTPPPFLPYGAQSDMHSVPPSSPGYTARPESMMYGSEVGTESTQQQVQAPLRMMSTSPPPAFNTLYAPQAQHATYDTSMLGIASGSVAGAGVPPGVNEKATYQGSPPPTR